MTLDEDEQALIPTGAGTRSTTDRFWSSALRTLGAHYLQTWLLG